MKKERRKRDWGEENLQKSEGKEKEDSVSEKIIKKTRRFMQIEAQKRRRNLMAMQIGTKVWEDEDTVRAKKKKKDFRELDRMGSSYTIKNDIKKLQTIPKKQHFRNALYPVIQARG